MKAKVTVESNEKFYSSSGNAVGVSLTEISGGGGFQSGVRSGGGIYIPPVKNEILTYWLLGKASWNIRMKNSVIFSDEFIPCNHELYHRLLGDEHALVSIQNQPESMDTFVELHFQ